MTIHRCAICNKIYYYYIKPLNLFILTLVISLIINPNYIYDVGFQYSYLISLSLISLSCNFNNTSYFKNLLKTSYTCFIVSIPISLYNFCQINLLSIIYNLFYVPLISIIIFPLSLLVFIFPKLNIIYNLLIIVLEKSSMFLSKISIGKIVFMKVPVIIYLVYLLLILLYIFKCANKAYLWKTVLIGLLYGGSKEISCPLSKIFPLVGSSKPAIILKVVVLPHPEGPRKVTNSPFFILRLKCSTAYTSLSGNFLHTSLSSIMYSGSLTFSIPLSFNKKDTND